MEALSSIEICIRSFGSRTRSTSVSTMFFESTLNEYCALLKGAEAGNSRRTRTQLAVELGARRHRLHAGNGGALRRAWNARAPLRSRCQTPAWQALWQAPRSALSARRRRRAHVQHVHFDGGLLVAQARASDTADARPTVAKVFRGNTAKL